ncbi:hypothetical protein [Streptomyces sp. AM 2-1-1]|uniref:hypothetical protein n=1 Tax=Streptomyces sp. AM 2-1-1 TaxID=3028709 RepID=UPI0023B99A62|nr:hypothetical protein [Streptomyces sp. AM 2-1-1]WEH42943.1 hypothetical protein PZB77_27500 [Streptomyces sp. AM 2-1-1]
MRAAVLRRSVLAVPVATLVVLTPACGSSSETPSARAGSPEATVEAETTTTAALSTAELRRAALVQGDVPGYVVGKADEGITGPVTVDRAVCLPFALALFAAPQKGSVGATGLTVTKSDTAGVDTGSVTSEDEVTEEVEKSVEMTTSLVTLSSYEEEEATAALAGVRAAATACSAGFTARVEGRTQEVFRILPAGANGGQAAAGWTTSVGDADKETPFSLVVARQGSTLVSFTTMDAGAYLGKRPATDEVSGPPATLVSAQLAKLS